MKRVPRWLLGAALLPLYAAAALLCVLVFCGALAARGARLACYDLPLLLAEDFSERRRPETEREDGWDSIP